MLLLASAGQGDEVGVLGPAARALAAAFWPGGLTLVVPQRPDVGLPAALTGGAPTIGLRLPDHPTPRALAAAVGPIPTTSANRSGRPEGRDAAEIVDQVGDAVDLVLDGGPAHGGPASTVVDCSGDRPRVLRVGAVPLADVVAALDRAGLPHALVVGRRG
jgi:tRNA threonylcarbamoyl adenosine modification protein (Sua5/YciO/YrdC/YwlC family)